MIVSSIRCNYKVNLSIDKDIDIQGGTHEGRDHNYSGFDDI